MGAKYNDGREELRMTDKGGSTEGDYKKSLQGASMSSLKKGYVPGGRMAHEDTCSDGMKPD